MAGFCKSDSVNFTAQSQQSLVLFSSYVALGKKKHNKTPQPPLSFVSIFSMFEIIFFHYLNVNQQLFYRPVCYRNKCELQGKTAGCKQFVLKGHKLRLMLPPASQTFYQLEVN